jgi:hypothetical protein
MRAKLPVARKLAESIAATANTGLAKLVRSSAPRFSLATTMRLSTGHS